MHGGKWLNSEHKKCNERTCNTLRVILAPNHTSPATLRLSSSMMLGIDLNRLKKLATCQEEKKKSIIIIKKEKKNLKNT
jgi:hypothetical protein